MKKITLLWIFAMLTLQTVVAAASISGVVKNGATAVSGATVELILPYTDASHQYQNITTTTDSEGAYSFSSATLSGYNVIQSIKLNSWQNGGTNYYPSNINNVALTGVALEYNFNTQNTAAVVSITSPAASVSTNTGGSIALEAALSLNYNDGYTSITSVVFSVDGSTVSSTNSGATYSANWSVSPSDFDTAHTFSVTAQTSNGESVTENFDFTLYTNYDLSFLFENSDNIAIPGVTVQWKDSFGGVLSELNANASGEVTFTDVLPYESYTFTYALDGYNFLPSEYSLTAGSLNSNMAIDVLGSNEQLTISGTIVESGSALENVVVTLKNAADELLSVHNSIDGTFAFEGVIPGYEYNVIASKSYYTLTSINYATLNASVNDAVLTGTRNTHTVSGTITTGGSALQGITVEIDGNGQHYESISDSDGNYQVASLAAGYNYTVTPNQAGYIFLPLSESITLLDENKSYNFSEDTRKIFGTVKSGNTPVSGATVELILQYQDEAHQYQNITATTDSEGVYSFDRSLVDGYNSFESVKLNNWQNGGVNYYPSSINNVSLTGGQLEYDYNTDTSIPTISFSNPLISASASDGGTVPLEANVALNYNDGSSSLSSVVFSVDGNTVSSTNTADAYSANWTVSSSDFNAEHIFKITAQTTNGYSLSDSIYFSLYELGVASDVFYISETGAVNGDATSEATAATRISTILATVESGDEIRLISGKIEETTNLTIPAGVQLVLESGVVMDMGANDFNNMGNIVLETGANFIQEEGSALTGSGTFEVIRETTAGSGEYNYLSSPIATSDIVGVFSGSFVVRYNPSAAVTLNDGWEFISSGQMELGRGYAISGKQSDSFSGRRYFNGIPNNGDVSITIDGATYGGEGDQWNLIGNPYPSSIDMLNFFAENSGIGAVYIYNQAESKYETHNVLSDPDGLSIASGQAFFVHASQVAQTINFSNGMRVQENANILRTAALDKTSIHLYKNEEELFNTQIAFHAQASKDYDIKYDAPLLPGASSAMIYSICNNQPMAIQALGRNEGDKLLPLGIQSEPGTYRIQANGTNLPYLIDKELNLMHNLAEGDYTFDFLEDTANETRFELWYPKVSKDAEMLMANFQNGYLQVRNYTDSTVEQVNIYDAMGKQISSWSNGALPEQNQFELNTNHLPSTIYLIELKTDQFSRVIKTAVIAN